MAHIERRVSERRDVDGRTRRTVRYKVRYRDSAGREHSETKTRRIDAERRKSEIEFEMVVGSWRDPSRGDVLPRVWVDEWLPTRHDLRATTRARLETTMSHQVLPRFGGTALRKITNSDVRRWVADLLSSGLSAASSRKAVFGLRQALEAAIADGRLSHNAAAAIPLPAERQKPPRFLSVSGAGVTLPGDRKGAGARLVSALTRRLARELVQDKEGEYELLSLDPPTLWEW